MNGNGASLFFVVTLALAVTALPPRRVRRQFDWGQFEGPSDWDNNANTIRIPRQRAPESWGSRTPNNWNQASGRQLPQNFGGNTGFDNTGFGNTGLDNTGLVNTGFDNTGFDLNGFGNGANNGVGNGVSTTTDPSSTTSATATYRNCMNRCQFTREYNPVCGTDANTYSNEQELNCAARCGRVVQLFRGGTCQPL